MLSITIYKKLSTTIWIDNNPEWTSTEEGWKVRKKIKLVTVWWRKNFKN